MTNSLENLIRDYQLSRRDDLFTDIYYELSERLVGRAEKLSAKYHIDIDDAKSVIGEKIFEVVKKYRKDDGDFMRYLNTAIKFGCIDLLRKDIQIEEISESFFATEEDENIFDAVIIETEQSAEDTAIENIIKSRDQRQLIAALTDLADEPTRQSVSAYIEAGSYNAAAKLLGTPTMARSVKRRIERLKKFYNAEEMGELHDYYTIAV